MPYTKEYLQLLQKEELKDILKRILAHKSHIKEDADLNPTVQGRKRLKKLREMAQKDKEYEKYIFVDKYKGRLKPEMTRSVPLLIDEILEAQNLKPIDESNVADFDYKKDILNINKLSGQFKEGSGKERTKRKRTRFEKQEKVIEDIANLEKEDITLNVIKEGAKALDLMIEDNEHEATADKAESIQEATAIVLNQIVELSEKTTTPSKLSTLQKTFDLIDRKSEIVSSGIFGVSEPVFVDKERFEKIQKSTNDFRELLRNLPKVKEENTMKRTMRNIPEIKEEVKEDVKEDVKKFEPLVYGDEQNKIINYETENAEYLNKNNDKDIGNIRAIGFLGPMDELAKEEDVLLPETERSKSIRRFTNFRWVDSIQNSKLGYASPFQRMEDIDDRRRYGKCFMQTNKLPKVDTEEDVKKFETFNEYPLVPSFKLSGIAQPATEFSFKTSTNPNARKINIMKNNMELKNYIILNALILE